MQKEKKKIKPQKAGARPLWSLGLSRPKVVQSSFPAVTVTRSTAATTIIIIIMIIIMMIMIIIVIIIIIAMIIIIMMMLFVI